MTSLPLGLSLQSGVISSDKEEEIIKWLDSKSWSNELSRRTQHYGYGYNYRGKNLTPGPNMEGPILEIAQMLEKVGLMQPVQCIINEYYRNQGIAPHIDNLAFGPTVIGVSIGADGVLVFEKGCERFECFLPRGSIMMMTGPARYEWKHSIDKRVTYKDSNGEIITKLPDYRRISLTFRELSSK